MEEMKRRLLILYESGLFTRKRLRKIVEVESSMAAFETCSKNELMSRYRFTEPEAQRVSRWLQMSPFQSRSSMETEGLGVLTIFDSDYPPILACIPDPPLILYFKGNPQLLTHLPSLSVVGTRKPSREAKDKMMSILSPLVKNEWMLISGMARGIDSYAHHMVCHFGGKTIAVLGSGHSHVYPPENKALFQRLSADHLVLSEYPPVTPPRRFHFPERNRIISGLSFATLVVEAEEKSGSLITADQALEQGRDVFAIPGSPLSPQAQGVNKLIQQGAKLINSSADIMEEAIHTAGEQV